MLKSFVSPDDYEFFIDMLRSIKNNTWKKDIRLIVLYGEANTGKSTLIEVMKAIALSHAAVPLSMLKTQKVGKVYDTPTITYAVEMNEVISFITHINLRRPFPYIDHVNSSLVTVEEAGDDKCNEVVSDILKWLSYNTNTLARRLYSKEPEPLKPGVFVFSMYSMPNPDIWVRNKANELRTIQLHMPNKFKYDCDVYDDIVDQCVKEALLL